jgi:hypothetical protein
MTAPSSLPNAPRPGEPLARARSYTPGFADELGDRQLAFDHANATSLEVLRFKKEFDSQEFEVGLRSRVEAFRDLQHPSVAQVRGVERLEGEGLSLVSKHTTGRRVSELIEKARGPVFALELIRQVTPALATLQLGQGMSHGALSADRIIVTRDGRLVVVEHVLGAAIESQMLSRQRLIDLGLVVAAGTEPFVLDARTDMIQLGFIALGLLLGRKLNPADYPDRVPALLDEFTQSGGSTIVSTKLRAWLERALQIGKKPFASAREAHDAFGELPDDIDLQAAEASRTLLSFPSGEAAGSPSVAPAPAAKPRTHHPTEESAVDHGRGRQKVDTFAHSHTIAASRWSGPAMWVAAALAVVASLEGAMLVVLYARPAVDVIELKSPKLEASRTLSAAALLPLQSPSSQAAYAALGQQPPAPKPEVAPPPTPDPAAPVPSGPKFGGITVASTIDLQVFKDGKLLGSSAGPIAVNEGSHRVELVNEALGFRLPQTVNVRSGQMTSLNISVPNGRVSINAAPWADVTIDGTPAGQTPLANLSLPIGTHEIVFKHPQFGERKQTITVKVEGLTRVSQSFQQQ